MTVLRCANVLGPDVETGFTRMFGLPMVPMVLGFDPRLQFVHEDDVVHALEHAALNAAPGIFNVAADGVLALSEAIGAARQAAAADAAAGRGRACWPGRCAGSASASPTRWRTCCASAAGSTTAATRRPASTTGSPRARRVIRLGEHMRLEPVLRGRGEESYHYERGVEEFLRWSPHVRRERARRRAWPPTASRSASDLPQMPAMQDVRTAGLI